MSDGDKESSGILDAPDESGDVSRADRLAKELGIFGNHTIPNIEQKRAETEVVLQRLQREIVPEILKRPKRARGKWLLQFAQKIDAIFDTYQDMWRFPAYLNENSTLYTMGGEEKECAFQCIALYLFYLIARYADGAHKKYSSIPSRIAHIVLHGSTYATAEAYAERDIEIRTAWGRRYEAYLQKLLENSLLTRFSQLLQHPRPKTWNEKNTERQIRLQEVWNEPNLPFEALWCESSNASSDPKKDTPHISFCLGLE